MDCKIHSIDNIDRKIAFCYCNITIGDMLSKLAIHKMDISGHYLL